MVHPEKNSTGQGAATKAGALAAGLYVVATPIGNLGDVTRRAQHVLAQADLLLAEDRRVASKLLGHIGASPPVENYNDHNAAKVRPGILRKLSEGAAIALTSDAGTPLISDPGYKLVDEVRAAGLPVFAIPGPSAAIAALSVAGLPTDRFLFLGFGPVKQGARRRWIEEVADVRATLIIYESPRRLPDLLVDLQAELGERPACVARELTKLHEEVRRGTLNELAAHYQDVGSPRGEVVVLVAWAEDVHDEPPDPENRLRELMAQMPLRDAVDAVSVETGMKRREVYRRALALKESDGQT